MAWNLGETTHLLPCGTALFQQRCTIVDWSLMFYLLQITGRPSCATCPFLWKYYKVYKQCCILKNKIVKIKWRCVVWVVFECDLYIYILNYICICDVLLWRFWMDSFTSCSSLTLGVNQGVVLLVKNTEHLLAPGCLRAVLLLAWELGSFAGSDEPVVQIYHSLYIFSNYYICIFHI